MKYLAEKESIEQWTLLFWTDEFKLWVKVKLDKNDNESQINLEVRNECTFASVSPETVHKCMSNLDLMQKCENQSDSFEVIEDLDDCSIYHSKLTRKALPSAWPLDKVIR